MSSDTSSPSSRTRESAGGHIELQDLRKTFDNGSVVACENVNLEIGSGEFIVLLGPSGCGKTTTLRCIAGLETPDSGTIRIAGEDRTYHKPKDRNLAFVFQSVALFPHMSVRDNMRFGLDANSGLSAEQKRKRVEDAAEMLGIGDLLDRQPSALSGGQQQRVTVGRAMVTEPDAFLLDEPFSALDANLRDKMRVEIKKLQRELDKSMIFVTHDQEEAMTLGDKIVVMNDGWMQQVGSPHEIYNEPANRFVADFIGSPSTNFFECSVEQTDDGVVLEHDRFTLPLTDEQRAAVVETEDVVELGIRPEHIVISASTALFEAEITVIEPHGTNDAVYLDAEGLDVTAVTSQGEITEENRTVAIDFDRDALWLFDQEGERLY